MKVSRIIFYAIVILVAIFSFMASVHYKVFAGFTDQKFNNIATPLATIIAAIIYYKTLLTIRKQSAFTINQFKYNFRIR